jgi:hypothetical protein
MRRLCGLRGPGFRRPSVMSMVSNFGLDRILAEVAKCDIVCANCHHLRTDARRPKRQPERE